MFPLVIHTPPLQWLYAPPGVPSPQFENHCPGVSYQIILYMCKDAHIHILTQWLSPQGVSVQLDFPKGRQRFATTVAGTTARAAIRTTPFSSLHACCTTGTPASTRCQSTRTTIWKCTPSHQHYNCWTRLHFCHNTTRCSTFHLLVVVMKDKIIAAVITSQSCKILRVL